MKKTLLFCALPILAFLYPWTPEFNRGHVLAQSIKQKTLTYENSSIEVRLMGKADVVKVTPYIKAKKGKNKGRLWVDVVIKNSGSEPQAYQIFGQGKVEGGGWLGSTVKAPKKGKLDPGKEMTVKIKTRYKGEKIPKQIRVEVF